MRRKRWSGIPIKKSNNIEKCVKYYCVLLCGLGLAIGIGMFLTLFAYVKSYNKIIDSIYSLQEMRDELDKMEEYAMGYVLLGTEEEKEAYHIAQKNVNKSCQGIEDMPIGGNFQRNLADLKILIESYGKKLELIMDRSSLSGKEKDKEESILEAVSLDDFSRAVQDKNKVITNEVQKYFQKERDALGDKLSRLLYLMVFFFAAGLFLIWQNTSILTRKIVLPLKRLTAHVKNIRENMEGILPSVCDIKQSDPVLEEIEVLQNSFLEMWQRIQTQISELKETMRVKEQLKEQEMENLRMTNLLTLSELHCLQMQMNPHFLFNTLNMIQQTLYLEQKEKTSRLLKETASFLRYSLDYIGKDVRLKQELEVLGNYINLQEERLGDRILFEFTLDERMNEWYVPCLILQPLVENSIIHGMCKKCPGALITIRTAWDERTGNGYIYISDNGQGMTREKLEELRKSLTSNDMRAEDRIGLHNVSRRLSLFKRGRAELRIDSRQGEGTEITIVLYDQKKGETHEGIDSR